MNYIKNLTKFEIVSKEGLSVPFVCNKEQERFISSMTNRDIILKSRQIGFSSAILGMFTIDFLLKENSRSVCISHDSPSAQKLLDRVKYFIKSAEDKGLAVNLKYNSRNELVNSDKNSSFYIGAAGNKTFGRGDTLTNLHLSEFAFYPDQEAMLASVLQAVIPTGKVIIESTPNGVNYFRDFWDRSKQDMTGFKCHFFDNSFYSEEFLKQKERELGEDLFKQEYPANDVECFLFSGSPFFDTHALAWYLKTQVRDPEKTGNVALGSENKFMQSADGVWKLWEEPQRGFDYLISCDFGQATDYSASKILKRKTLEVVATYHGKMDVNELGLNLIVMGRWYNNAIIIPEVNSSGLALLNVLTGNGYGNIYQRGTFDKMRKDSSDKLGFLTTSSTRPLMLSELQAMIRERSIKIYDKDTIEELFSFVRDEKTGKPQAVQGKHDDRVIALALLARAYNEMIPLALVDDQNRQKYGSNFQFINEEMNSKNWSLK